jgi:hypothetical protein
MNRDFQRDCGTLRTIAADVAALAERMAYFQREMTARERGYFLADEDDQVRRLYLAYRNYRIALLDIVYRHEPRAEEEEQAFLLAFGAAVLLFGWSSLLVHSYREIPHIRAKLNEADPRFDLQAGLFEQIYDNLTASENQGRLNAAAKVFAAKHAALVAMFAGDADFTWLIAEIAHQYETVRRSWWGRQLEELRLLARNLKRDTVAPFREMSYYLKSLTLDFFGNVWFDEKPEIQHMAQFAQLLQPGDVVVVRPERKASTVFLPGWWTHAALFHGGPEGIRPLGLDWPSGASNDLVTMEALAAGVVLNPLVRTLQVDHAVLLRPRLDERDRGAALRDAFAHLGKPYDFEFDFTRSDRLVCTELIYRSFHGKGGIRFEPVQRLGRPTISADDIVRSVCANLGCSDAPFEPIAISRKNTKTGRERFLTGHACERALRATIAGSEK